MQPANDTSSLTSKVTTLLRSSSVATLSVGPIWGSGGSQQTLLVNPGVIRTYTANQPTTTLAEGDLFLGLQRTLTPLLKGQLGLDVAVTSAARLSGDIWDFGDPRFNNYNYTYSLQHTRLALKGKLLAEMDYYSLTPWISRSLGVGFNQSSGFNTTSTLYEVIILPGSNFTKNTTTSFTYTLGLGIQRALTPHWQVGVGYEFADWGRSALSVAPLQTQGAQGLSPSHFYTNGLLFNLTWLA